MQLKSYQFNEFLSNIIAIGSGVFLDNCTLFVNLQFCSPVKCRIGAM